MASEFERQPAAGQDGFSPLLGSGSPGSLRLKKIHWNPGEDSLHAQVDDAPGASGAVCEDSLLPELCGRTAQALRAAAGCSDLVSHPRNQRQGSRPGKPTERVGAGPFSFRRLWDDRLIRHIQVVFVGAYEDQPQAPGEGTLPLAGGYRRRNQGSTLSHEELMLLLGGIDLAAHSASAMASSRLATPVINTQIFA